MWCCSIETQNVSEEVEGDVGSTSEKNILLRPYFAAADQQLTILLCTLCGFAEVEGGGGACTKKTRNRDRFTFLAQVCGTGVLNKGENTYSVPYEELL